MTTAIFSGVRYALSTSNKPDDAQDLEQLLDANGATNTDLDDDELTHVITPTWDFENKHMVGEGCSLVTPFWVERSQILGKMQEPEFYSPDPEKIFSGVYATSSGLHPTDNVNLVGVLQRFGGQYSTAYTRSVTHLISASTESDKYSCAMKFRQETGVKVVVPHWWQDCISTHSRLEEKPYEYPDPEVLSGRQLEKGSTTHVPDRERMHLFRALTEDLGKPTVEKARPTRDVWGGRTIFISSQLSETLPDRMLQELKGDIVAGRGKLALSLRDAKVLVAKYREGDDYEYALKNKLTIGNLEWIRHVHRVEHYTTPTQQLLHYPTPSYPILGFGGVNLTVTNYTGPAREYLKKLITIMGGNYTANFTASNTAVIAAYIQGTKTDKAREWKIPVINHRWLEECYQNWVYLKLAQPQYLDFPTGMDWSQVLATRAIGEVKALDGTEQKFVDDAPKTAGQAGPSKSKSPSKSPHKPSSPAKSSPIKGRLPPTGQSGVQRFEVDLAIGDPMHVDDDEQDEGPEDSSPIKAHASKKEKGKAKEIPVIMMPKIGPKSKITPRRNEKKDRIIDISDEEPSTSRPTSPLKPVTAKAKKVRTDVLNAEPTPRPSAATKGKDSARKPTKPAYAEVEEEEEEEEEPVRASSSKGKGKATRATQKKSKKKTPSEASEESSDDSDGMPEFNSILEKGKRERERRAEEEEEHKNKISTSKTPAKSKSKARADSPPPPKPTPRPRPTKKLNRVESFASLHDDASDDELSIQPPPPRQVNASGKIAGGSGKRKPAAKIDDDEDENIPFETSQSSAGAGPRKKKKPLVEIAQEKVDEDDDNDDDEVQVIKTPAPMKAKGKDSGGKQTSSAIKEKARSKPTPGPKSKVRPPPPREEEEEEEPPEYGQPSDFASEHEDDRNNARGRPSHPAGSSQISIGTANRSFSRRSAATKAGEKLRNDMADLNDFQVQMKKGSVRGAWEQGMKGGTTVASGNGSKDKKRASPDGEEDIVNGRATKKQKVGGSGGAVHISVPVTPATGRKKPIPASALQVIEVDSDDEATAVVAGNARKPTARPPQRKVKIAATQVAISDSDAKTLKKMGATIVGDGLQCTHLVTNKIVRTEKFLCALAVAPKIVNEQWMRDSIEAATWQDEDQYLLKDQAGESKWKIDLATTMERAQQHPRKFLKGHSFIATKNCSMDLKLLQNIIAAHGGEWISQKLTKRLVQGHSNCHIISSMADKPDWIPIAQDGVPIYEPDTLINGIMTQEMDWSHDIGRGLRS